MFLLLFQAELGAETCEVMRLSAPLKKQYAVEHNLDFSRLLDACKSQFRLNICIFLHTLSAEWENYFLGNIVAIT